MGEFDATEGKDAGFQRHDAGETPFGIGQVLDHGAFVFVGGLELGGEVLDVLVVFVDVVGFQEDRLAGEPGFDGVVG